MSIRYKCPHCYSYSCSGICRKHKHKSHFSQGPSKRRRLEKSPNVKNLLELAELAKNEDVVYTNINSIMLKSIAPHLTEMMGLVGMGDLKESIFYQVLYYLQNMHVVCGKNDFMHTCLMGGPGVGKTTVAKIIAEMYRCSGILSAGVFRIATRSDLIGGYLGQTAIKTREVLESCIGGVLFIDEIYSLGSGEARGTDSYSKECIDTINGFMSEHKHDFCLIVAGYEKEIERCFFSVNAGLSSRFPWRHSLKPYTPDELSEIALKMVASSNWKTNASAKDLSAIIAKNHKEVFTSEARSIENWIAKVKLAHSKRVFVFDFVDKFTLNIDDFNQGAELMKKNKCVDAEPEAPPGMYT